MGADPRAGLRLVPFRRLDAAGAQAFQQEERALGEGRCARAVAGADAVVDAARGGIVELIKLFKLFGADQQVAPLQGIGKGTHNSISSAEKSLTVHGRSEAAGASSSMSFSSSSSPWESFTTPLPTTSAKVVSGFCSRMFSTVM